jgi:hypothetical protein
MQLETELALRIDPAAMFPLLLGVEADDWQGRLLRSESRWLLTLVGRQLGKSSCAAMKLLHVASFTPGVDTLIISPGERQSLLILQR